QPDGVVGLLEIEQRPARSSTVSKVCTQSRFSFSVRMNLSAQPCRLHVAFHGCNQSTEKVHDLFIRDAAYNRWQPPIKSSCFTRRRRNGNGTPFLAVV